MSAVLDLTDSPTRCETEAELREKARMVLGSWDYELRCDGWTDGFDIDFSRELSRNGLLAMTWPKKFGGGEYSSVQRLAVTEELLRAGAPTTAHWVGERQIGPSLLKYGSPELQEEFLPPLARAEMTFALGMSEPDSGSDLASLRTKAIRDGDSWVISGRKIWTSVAHKASHLYVLARTDSSGEKHSGLSEFIVDANAPGIEIHPIVDFDHQHHFNEVVFDEVVVPGNRLIGVEGRGWQQVVGQLAFERGGPERFLSMHPLLKVIADNGLVGEAERSDWAKLVGQLAALRQLARKIAVITDEGESPVVEAAVCKYLGNTFEKDVVTFSRRLLHRFDPKMKELFVQAQLASPKSGIRGGAAQILLTIIAKASA